MDRHPQPLALPRSLPATPPLNLYDCAAAVMVLNDLLLEKLERILPDDNPGEHTSSTLLGLSELCWRTSSNLRACLESSR